MIALLLTTDLPTGRYVYLPTPANSTVRLDAVTTGTPGSREDVVEFALSRYGVEIQQDAALRVMLPHKWQIVAYIYHLRPGQNVEPSDDLLRLSGDWMDVFEVPEHDLGHDLNRLLADARPLLLLPRR